MGLRLMVETVRSIGRGVKEVYRLVTMPLPVTQEVPAWNHDESHRELEAIPTRRCTMAMLKPHKCYLYRVTVVGSGPFPVDMLRYDRCVPASETDSYKIANTFSYEKDRGQVEIVVVQHAANKTGPTVGRWNSFTWGVKSTEEIEG